MDQPEKFTQELDHVFEESGMAELLRKHTQHLGHSNKTPKNVSQRSKTFFCHTYQKSNYEFAFQI